MSQVPTRVLAVVLLLVALVLAGVLSFYASSDPDGLNRVAEDQGLAAQEQPHGAADGPLAGYETTGVGDPRLSRGVAGVVGAFVVLVVAGGLGYVVRRRTPDETADATAPTHTDR